MRKAISRKSAFAIAALATVVLAVTAACSPARSTPSSANKIVPFPIMSPTVCAQVEFPPKIIAVRPDVIKPGSEVTVSASGGYVRDDCGAIYEGAALYQLYLDDAPVADLPCYVNRCEGKFILPKSVPAGVHCLGVQKGTCQMKLQVTGG